MSQPGTIVDLFAGPGGWSEGLRMLGLEDIGIERDRDACLTRRAAGHLTVRADVVQYPPEPFRGAWGLIASPPCPDWSTAGSMMRREGKSGWLVDAVPRWVDAVRPEWIACEQVPAALSAWQEHAHRYRQLGYSVWCGVLDAADYGVPQRRRRAFLVAHQTAPALPPTATHSERGDEGLFGSTMPWVPMQEALGWSGTVDRRQFNDGEPVRLVPTDEPAPTLTGMAGAKGVWVMDRWPGPAPTVTGGGAAADGVEVFANAAQREQLALGRQPTIAECLALQTFREGYPVQGKRASRYTQIGNAVPPLLAAHVLSALTGASLQALEVSR